MNKSILSKLFLFIFVIYAPHSISQDLLNDVESDISLGDTDTIFSETINIISRSGKIFIMSNGNQLLSKGDFITLSVKDDGPVARAVVAKTYDGNAGIKILKVYSLARWAKLRKGLAIDIKRGDDSSLFGSKKKAELDEVKEDARIVGEEDLFNEKNLIEEDLGDFYKDNRLIKPDNIITGGYNQLSFVDEVTTDTITGHQFNFSWGYQFSDNYWVEGLFGNTQIDDFPVRSSQTIVNNYTLRFKYTIKAPLYSYVMPYIGVQTIDVSSPDAGIPENNSSSAQETADKEQQTIDELEKTTPVIGVTVLRRLVPGWFLKLDLGTDIVSVGFGIEF